MTRNHVIRASDNLWVDWCSASSVASNYRLVMAVRLLQAVRFQRIQA